MPIIYHEGYSLGGSSDANQLLKDTVGWIGKNLAIPQEGYALDGDDSTGYRIRQSGTNSLCYIAKVENGESYIVSKAAGNRFRIVGFQNYPSVSTKEATAKDIYIGSGTTETYMFSNTGNWAYIVFMVNYDNTFDYSTAHGMIRRADILDDTYEPYHESVETMYEEEIHGVNLAIAYPNYALLGDPTAGYQILSNKTGALLYIAPIKHNTSYIASKAQVGNRFRIVLFKNEPSSVSSTDAYQVIRENDTDRTSYEFTNTDYNYVVFATAGEGGGGNVNTTNGMIRLATIEDSTYRPYNPQAIQNQLNAQGVLGAKNLLPYPYFDSDTLTNSGITYTVNSDKSVTLSGTATANNRFYFVQHTGVILSNVKKPYCNQGYKYVLSAKGVADKYDKIWIEYVYQNISNGNWTIFRTDNAQNKKEIILPSDMSAYKSVGIYIVVSSGTKISTPMTIYPMLRLASDPDDTYQPYAMTNRELTEKKADIYTKGDTVECGLSLFGHITTGTKKLELTLRGNFDNANISNVSVGTKPVLIRGVKGYLKTDDGVELNSRSFSKYLKLDSVHIFPQHIDLTISLISDGMFTNVDNNTLIDIQNMTLILS